MRVPAVQRQHAIVIGGSLAGLLTARVLSDHFDEITVIERDALPAGAAQRRGVPQGRHTHGLLASGRHVLEDLYPGFSDSLVEAGAVIGDVVRDMRWFCEGGCLARPASGLQALFISRPMLEGAIRARTLALPNVRPLDNVQVNGLASSPDRARVVGVRVNGETLAAELVVDATGRGSRSPQWLQMLGYEPPRRETIHMDVGYTTRLFRRLPSHLRGACGAVVTRTPEGKRGGVMIAQEGDRWTVTLTSYFDDYAPEDLDGFIEFARSLAAPYIYDVVRHAEPLGEASTTRFSGSVRRYYETVKRFPKGFLVIGDAIGSFNPIYGQGMSAAALQVLELRKTLEERPVDLARPFFRRAARVIDIPWRIAAGSDLRMPEVVGRRTLALKLANWYMPKLHRAGHTDAQCALAFQRVSNLLASPPSVMHPRIAFRVLLQYLTPGHGYSFRQSSVQEHTDSISLL
jgi:2-polyprenyl-6-methoxyphenol hydroxylase-like FAD-dependent oxidoreductase